MGIISERWGVDRLESFIRARTAISSPPLCPELRLHTGKSLDTVWRDQEAEHGTPGLPPPFWAVHWVGGQTLARYVLDYPQQVVGRRVLDFGTGSGICAIAAAKAAPAAVEACDIDPFAVAAVRLNAMLNQVTIRAFAQDLIGCENRWDVVLAADLWYERFLATRLTPWLRRLAAEGCLVLAGDLGRAFFPRHRVQELARYHVATPLTMERDADTAGRVWRLLD